MTAFMVDNMEKVEFAREDKYGFWRQRTPAVFEYDADYKQSQSTNTDMSYLRIGWLASFLPYSVLKKMTVVDIGSGNGTFVRVGQSVFGSCCGFDVQGESITREELYGTHWDMVVLSDVLEHFEDIEDLFKMKWEFAFISFPETPLVQDQDQLRGWRHFKPNEHLWCLNVAGMVQWFESHECKVLGRSNVEDLIRTRWDEGKPNISSLLVGRPSHAKIVL